MEGIYNVIPKELSIRKNEKSYWTVEKGVIGKIINGVFQMHLEKSKHMK